MSERVIVQKKHFQIATRKVSDILQRKCSDPSNRPLACDEFDSTPRTFMREPFGQNFSEVPIHISAQSPKLSVDDPIHKPIIEDYRRRHGSPEGGVDEFGRRVGPSDAGIKYDGLAVREAREARRSILYVNFQTAMPPSLPDHSQRHPGTGAGAAQRAGYTRVTLQKQMNISWDTGPVQDSGLIPLFAKSVNVFYRLDPIKIYVSADYPKGSCPYRVTLNHERSHVRAFIKLFRSAHERLGRQLEDVQVPTRDMPVWVRPDNVEASQDIIGENLRQVVLLHSAALVSQMEADRDAKDAPSAYASEYAKCPQW